MAALRAEVAVAVAVASPRSLRRFLSTTSTLPAFNPPPSSDPAHQKPDVQPSTNLFISGLRKQGKVEEGMELLERMKREGCYPNAGSYQEVLYGLLDKGMYVEAKGVAGGMISEGMTPSFVSFKKLIRGFCRKMAVEDLDWVQKQMVQQGFILRKGMWTEIVQCVLSGNSTCISSRISEIVNS